jgi:hypothetical protein
VPDRETRAGRPRFDPAARMHRWADGIATSDDGAGSPRQSTIDPVPAARQGRRVHPAPVAAALQGTGRGSAASAHRTGAPGLPRCHPAGGRCRVSTPELTDGGDRRRPFPSRAPHAATGELSPTTGSIASMTPIAIWDDAEVPLASPDGRAGGSPSATPFAIDPPLCARCGRPLGLDPDDDPRGAHGLPMCGRCGRELEPPEGRAQRRRVAQPTISRASAMT